MTIKQYEIVEQMNLSSRQIAWFENNIDNTARETELIMSTISNSSTLYTPSEIIYSLSEPRSNVIDQLANLMEMFLVERLAERFYAQFASQGQVIKLNSNDTYAQLKSITLHLSKGNYDKLR